MLSESSLDLNTFFADYGEGVAAATRQAYPPRLTTTQSLPPLLRAPIGKQGIAAAALAEAVKRDGSGLAVCDMGTGKTMISLVASAKLGARRTLVLCPPHLVEKWCREVEATIPRAQTRVVSRVGDFKRVTREPRGDRPLYVVMSREAAKLSHGWRVGVTTRQRALTVRGEDGAETQIRVAQHFCPRCGALQETEKDGLVTLALLERAQRKCVACAEPLYQADPHGPRRFAVAHFIAKRCPDYFDLLIIDEAHEYKSKGAAQGIAAAALANVIPGVIGLTGTLFGGYASSIFYLLQRFSRTIRADYTFREETPFVQAYGVVERIITETAADERTGRTSKRLKTTTQTREKPGVSPLLLRYLLGNTVFLRLPDVADTLPSYDESVRLVEMDEEQAGHYDALEAELVQALKDTLRKGSKRLLGTYLTALLHYPDAPYKGERVFDPKTGELLCAAPPLDADTLYPKEAELLGLCQAERAAGRRVIVYVQGMERRDITARLHGLLSHAGLRTAVLKSSAVEARKREAWVQDRVKAGVDVLVVNPKAVQTGLDLLDFPTLVFYQTEYSVYTVRQASRRSWRIGQRQAVKVVHFAYARTLQHQAITLIAAKAQASLALEGELVDSGLTELAEQDLMTMLAKKLVAGARAHGAVTLNSVAADDPLSEMPEVLPVELVSRLPLVTGGGAAIRYAEVEVTLRGKGKTTVVPAGTGFLFPELMGVD